MFASRRGGGGGFLLKEIVSQLLKRGRHRGLEGKGGSHGDWGREMHPDPEQEGLKRFSIPLVPGAGLSARSV